MCKLILHLLICSNFVRWCSLHPPLWNLQTRTFACKPLDTCTWSSLYTHPCNILFRSLSLLKLCYSHIAYVQNTQHCPCQHQHTEVQDVHWQPWDCAKDVEHTFAICGIASTRPIWHSFYNGILCTEKWASIPGGAMMLLLWPQLFISTRRLVYSKMKSLGFQFMWSHCLFSRVGPSVSWVCLAAGVLVVTTWIKCGSTLVLSSH